MDLSAVPYLVVSRTLETGFAEQQIFVALCLIDHLVLGMGLSRDEALGKMIDELEKKHADQWIEPEEGCEFTPWPPSVG